MAVISSAKFRKKNAGWQGLMSRTGSMTPTSIPHTVSFGGDRLMFGLKGNAREHFMISFLNGNPKYLERLGGCQQRDEWVVN